MQIVKLENSRNESILSIEDNHPSKVHMNKGTKMITDKNEI